VLSKSSCGHNSISTKLLKSVISTTSQPLSHVFNLSFKSGTFPDRLKIAKVVPIFKGGDSTQYINFRPISLLPSVSKILEKLMYCRLIAYIEKFNLLNSNQFGFRTGSCTQDTVAHLVESITKKLDNHNSVSVLFVDVAKAFDSTNHSILLFNCIDMVFVALFITCYLST
jgi:hypothetical protein